MAYPRQHNQEYTYQNSGNHLTAQKFGDSIITTIVNGGCGGVVAEIKHNWEMAAQNFMTTGSAMNPNWFGKRTAGPTCPMKMNQGERFNIPDKLFKQTAFENSGGHKLLRLGLNDSMSKWKKLDRTSANRNTEGNQKFPIPKLLHFTDSPLYAKSRPILRFCKGSLEATTMAYNMHDPRSPAVMPRQGTSSPTSDATVSSVESQRTSSTVLGTYKSAPNIFQNLAKMKSMNRQAIPVVANPNLIYINGKNEGATGGSLSKTQKGLDQEHQPFGLSKQRMIQTTAFDNAFAVPDSCGENTFMEQTTLQFNQVHQPSPKNHALRETGVGGKAPPQKNKKNVNTNHFNPVCISKNENGVTKKSSNGKFKAVKIGTVSSSSFSSTTGTMNKHQPVSRMRYYAPPQRLLKKKKVQVTLKQLKSYVRTMEGTNYDMPKSTDFGFYQTKSMKKVWVCLVCKQTEEEESSREMIGCEICEDWYHWDCVGLKKDMAENDPWYCKRCIFQASPLPKKDFPKLFRYDPV